MERSDGVAGEDTANIIDRERARSGIIRSTRGEDAEFARTEMNMATPTDVDRDAPVVTDLATEINAPRGRVWRLHTDVNAWPTWQPDITEATAEEPLRPGASFNWSTYGMDITSTVYALDEGTRILWGGTANGITGIHEWTFADSPSGVRVTTTESFAGVPVVADVVNMQALLDQSLRSWLQHLKDAAEGV